MTRLECYEVLVVGAAESDTVEYLLDAARSDRLLPFRERFHLEKLRDRRCGELSTPKASEDPVSPKAQP